MTAPGGDIALNMKQGLFDRGHEAGAPTRLTLSAALARRIFVDADVAAGVQAFLSGEIQWKQGKREDAVRSWRGMTVESGNAYALSSAQMLDAIRAPAGRIDTRRVDSILDAEQGRWMMLSLDRLRQFGYQLETF